MQVKQNMALGVFDSGVGGLTVVKALRTSLPHEDIIYLGDTARVPYGSKSATTVIRYSRQTAGFLLGKGIKYLVIACNTASAHAVDVLRREVSVPVMGVVNPGARIAVQSAKLGKIGVIGTLGTITSGAYQQALHAINPALTVFGQPCPLFVPLTEEGWLTHPVTYQIARHYLSELQQSAGDLDTIVLGCTHYPLLKEVIDHEARTVFGHPVTLVDSALAVSQAVATDLAARELLRCDHQRGDEQFFLTDVCRFAEVATCFLGGHPPAPVLADL